MTKNPNFGSDFDPNLVPELFLDIIASYHYMQFQGKLIDQT